MVGKFAYASAYLVYWSDHRSGAPVSVSIQHTQGRICDYASLTRVQGMLMQLARGPHFENLCVRWISFTMKAVVPRRSAQAVISFELFMSFYCFSGPAPEAFAELGRRSRRLPASTGRPLALQCAPLLKTPAQADEACSSVLSFLSFCLRLPPPPTSEHACVCVYTCVWNRKKCV